MNFSMSELYKVRYSSIGYLCIVYICINFKEFVNFIYECTESTNLLIK